MADEFYAVIAYDGRLLSWGQTKPENLAAEMLKVYTYDYNNDLDYEWDSDRREWRNIVTEPWDTGSRTDDDAAESFDFPEGDLPVAILQRVLWELDALCFQYEQSAETAETDDDGNTFLTMQALLLSARSRVSAKIAAADNSTPPVAVHVAPDATPETLAAVGELAKVALDMAKGIQNDADTVTGKANNRGRRAQGSDRSAAAGREGAGT